jgi:hypothetical protein
MKYRGNIGVSNSSCCPSFTQKTEPRPLVAEISVIDDLQRDGIPKIDVEGFLSNAHCPTTQLDWSTVRIEHHFIVLESANMRSAVSLFGAGC